MPDARAGTPSTRLTPVDDAEMHTAPLPFAERLAELAADHRDRSPWRDRSDVPAAIRRFWQGVGVSSLSAELAPRPTATEDRAAIADVFAVWLEDAPTRDRWRVDDGAPPWERLPEQPRLLARERDRLLLADADTRLHVCTRRGSITALPTAELPWLMYELLARGTVDVTATMFHGPQLTCVPACVEPECTLHAIDDGVWLLGAIDDDGPAIGEQIVYRDLASYCAFVRARPPAERGSFGPPTGVVLELRLPSKGVRLDPRATAFEPGAMLIEGVGAYRPRPPHNRALIAELDGHAVWINPTSEKRVIGAVCDPDVAVGVRRWFEDHGAEVIDTGRNRATLAETW